MEIAVKKITGEDTGRKVSLSKETFAIEPNDHAIYLDVKRYLASQRQGTHKAKERAEISGSTRKLRKQKGSGAARVGSIKSPIFRGGGRVFGPRPRNYEVKLNKKLKVLARKSALSYKAKDNKISVIESFGFQEPKTKEYIKLLNNLDLYNKKSLMVLPEVDKNIYLSGRNIKNHEIIESRNLSTYDILNAEHLILHEDAIKQIDQILNKKKEE